MANVIFGNHLSVIVPRQDRDGIRKFYCDVLGGHITKGENDRDFLRLGDDFYIFLYGDVPDESELLRTARSVWLEIKSDSVEEMTRKILESGLVRKLEVPDPHLYFQAPGGQCLRLVGIGEDLSFYEGAGEGSIVAKMKEALNQGGGGQMSCGINRQAGIRGYAPVNGLEMYYEIEGTGDPLVYIPPAFSHAGVNSFPALVQSHSVITVDLQGHGRTADIPERPLTIGQHAEDVAGLLQYLGISKADFFGESYGGAIATLMAVRYPGLVGRVATYGATFGPPRIAVNSEMLRTAQPPSPESRAIRFQRENYRKAAPDPDYWPRIWGKVCGMQWGGFSNEELTSIEAPVLITLGDHDFVRLEHALETFRLIPNAEFAVIPDAGHFALFSEQQRVIAIVEDFLVKPDRKIPIATAETGYHPDETR